MKFKTVSGSEYEIRDGLVRRINPEHEKRADGEWVRLINNPDVRVGECAIVTTESLRRFGGDDYETRDEEANLFSTRITSTVTEVWDE